MTNSNDSTPVKRGGRPKGSRDKAPRKKRDTKVSFPGDLEGNCKADKPTVSKLLGYSLYWLDKPKPITDDEVEQRIYEFFARCVETGEIPTVEKMALALGTTTSTLWDWQLMRYNNCSPRKADAIKSAKQFLASFDAELVLNGDIPSVPYIFRSKNYYGMRDDPAPDAQNTQAIATSQDDLVRLYGETGAESAPDLIEGVMIDDGASTAP